jgi:CRISPR-associated protein (TIGR03986 family)
MPRTYFINPYNFVPLSNVPLLEKNNNPHHLWFDEDLFTGTIDVALSFVTPFVIPGKQTPGTDQAPGRIDTFTSKKDGVDHLAIPGTRIRGQLFNVMRALNSSPLQHYEKRVILGRETTQKKKGYLVKSGNRWQIQEVIDEILVVHPRRLDLNNLRLKDGCPPVTNPQCYSGGASIDIPPFGNAPVSGDIYWSHPEWGPPSLRSHKYYLSSSVSPKPTPGKWVKFPAWSGQDEENVISDIRNKRRVHQNAWHIVNMDKSNMGALYDIPDNIKDDFISGVEEMARLIGDSSDDTDKRREGNVRKMQDLAVGQFVYFTAGVTSFGRHYHYLFRKGAVDDKIGKANSANHGKPCIVHKMAGWASDVNIDGIKGMKSRVWIEMATGPKTTEVKIEPRNLRILASQPPKAFNFYLDGGDYYNSTSVARGRKFYWHNPHWKEKMWDNEDLQGEYAFENPTPHLHRKQWSNADVVMPDENGHINGIFDFTIRVMNLTDDELNLLLTALVGFSPQLSDNGFLGQKKWQNWCHKIGYARPYLGSAYFRVKNLRKLKFNEDTWEPELYPAPDATAKPGDLLTSEWLDVLNTWQAKLNGTHLAALIRMMNFNGAYEPLSQPEIDETRMTYPLKQDGNLLNWKGTDEAQQPKPFKWFKDNRNTPLPSPTEKQILSINPLPQAHSGSHGNPGSSHGSKALAFNKPKQRQYTKPGKGKKR